MVDHERVTPFPIRQRRERRARAQKSLDGGAAMRLDPPAHDAPTEEWQAFAVQVHAC